MSERHVVHVVVNGEAFEVEVESRKTLADMLRQDLRLTGTHLGCEHGTCGACTVLIGGEPARSCITLAVQADGQTIETVEGLAAGDGLHPLQEAFVRHQAMQCGYCTPGFLMIAAALVRTRPAPAPDAVRDALAANICRCTGYEPIFAAVMDYVEQQQNHEPH